jgi:hypothetical protein
MEAEPTAALHSREHAVRLGLERIHHVHRGARGAVGVVAVDELGRVDDAVAAAIPVDPRRAFALGAQRRDLLARQVVAVDAEHLVAAHRASEEEVLAGDRLEARVADRVGKIRERRRRGARLVTRCTWLVAVRRRRISISR